jgi:predicted ATPase
MAKILVTGMSGTGKSMALEILAARGHRAVDTDTDQWSHWVTLPAGSTDWAWREPAISDLLANHREGDPRSQPLPRASNRR